MFRTFDRGRPGCHICSLILTEWTCTRIFDCCDEATDALGMFVLCPIPFKLAFLPFSNFPPHSEPRCQLTSWQKTDAGLEVHQRLGPYLSTSALTSRMKFSVRIVNMLYIIRDYSPITTVLAMLLLPLVLMPTPGADDDFTLIANKQRVFNLWAQTLFLATHLARTLHGYFTYRHLNLSHVANIHSQELWSAPCKQADVHLFFHTGASIPRSIDKALPYLSSLHQEFFRGVHSALSHLT